MPLLRLPLLSALVISIVLPGCPGAGGPGGSDGGGEGEGEADQNPGVVEIGDAVKVTVAATPLVGFALAVRPDGRWAVAYVFRSLDPTEVPCITFGGGEPPTVPQNDIWVVDELENGDTRTRLVDTVPEQADGTLDMEADPVSGALVVAYMGGDIATGSCAASDLVVAVEDDPAGDTFTLTTVAAGSADAGSACRDPADPICALGDVVGRYPYVSFNADGAMCMSWLDTHFGFSNTDLNSSDAEAAKGTAGTVDTLFTINDSSGSGYFGANATLPDGRCVIGHLVRASNDFPDPENPGETYRVPEGINVAVEGTDGVFVDQLILEGGNADGRVSVHAHDGIIYATSHSGSNQRLTLFTSIDDGATFTPTNVEQLARTGTDPTVRTFTDGTLVLVYGHCRDLDDGAGCRESEDGIRVSTRRPQDDYFLTQTFVGDDEDRDGVAVDMVMLDDDTFVVSSASFPLGADGQPQRVITVQRFGRAE